MRNVLVGLCLLVIAALAGLFALPYVIDWNTFRGRFEEELTRVVGRDVRVGGRVHLTLLPSPRFDIERVRIADPGASSGEPFARIDRIEARVAIAPLFRGILEATEINLVKPELRLVLDGQGGGNWQTLTFSASHLPFVRDVALQSVTITGGQIVVLDETTAERLRIADIFGELTASALDGPYRFRGGYRADGREREVRFSTSKPEPDGTTRVKASIKLLDAALSASFDGQLLGGSQKPQLSGELTAEIPVPRIRRAQASQRVTSDQSAAPPAELKSQLKVTPDAATLTDVTVSFEQAGQPQFLTGRINSAWGAAARLDAEFTAQWLDIDQIIGLAPGESPLRALLELGEGANAGLSLGLAAPARWRVTVDQGRIGREQVSGVELVVASQPGNQATDAALGQSPPVNTVERLRLTAPGGTRIELSGRLRQIRDQSSSPPSPQLNQDPAAHGFVGALTVSGPSLVRAVGWFSGGAQTLDPATDAAFALRTDVKIGARRIEFTDAAGELAGAGLSGDVAYDWSRERRQISARIETDALDLRPFDAVAADVDGWATLLSSLPWAQDHDAVLSIRAGQLKYRQRTFENVEGRLSLDRQRLRVDRIAADRPGLAFELEGQIEDFAKAPRGVVRARLTANTLEGLATARDLFGVPLTFVPTLSSTPTLLPLDVAGTLTLHPGERRRTEVSAQGLAGPSRVEIAMLVDGPMPEWRKRLVDLSVAIEGRDKDRLFDLLGQLSPAARGLGLQRNVSAGGRPLNAAGEMPSRLTLKSVGVPASGMPSRIVLETVDAALELRGRLTPIEATTELSGDLTIRALDGAQLASLLPDLPRLGLERVPVQGRARIVVSEASLALSEMALTIGDTDVSGSVDVKSVSAADGKITRRADAKLTTSRATLAGVLAPVTTAAQSSTTEARSLRGQWPADPFDFRALDRLEATVDVKAETFDLAPSLSLGPTTLEIVVESGRLQIKTFTAQTRHGLWTGSVKMERTPIGGEVSAVIKLSDGRLERMSGRTAPGPTAGSPVEGIIQALVTMKGRGANLRGIVDALEGGGTLDAGELRISGVIPGGIEPAVETLVRSRDPVAPEAVRKAIEEAIDGGILVAKPARYAVTLADGALRIAPTTFEFPDGRSTADMVLDLATLTFASTWKLEARRIVAVGPTQAWTTETRKQAWPAVNVIVTGPLGSPDAINRQLLLDDVVREFAVRKVEHDVAELERLRRLDEERAREDAERRRRLEQAPPTPPLAAPAAAPASGLDQAPASPSQATPPGPSAPPTSTPLPLPGLPTQQPQQKSSPVLDSLAPQPVGEPPAPQFAPRPSTAPKSEPSPSRASAPKSDEQIKPVPPSDARRLFEGSAR